MAKNGGNSFLGFVAGAAAGALLGVLFAPDKGKNTRERLTFKLDKYREDLEDLVEDLLEERKVAVTAAKSEGQRVIDDAIKHAEELMGEVDALKERIATPAMDEGEED
ncbi:YtxH domain-containing protein [Flammeovirga kamogawensis]|uniref:YtxH domain-containing protein n=1 Tax=Flammeovirga kamogawensis TaxID=373891 RepID=A0ABX8GRX5_9BACT|nr:YtxH domain-containing protein [Flammeovirga kamogawensis]MBB6463819.1 gas vesicle protein [Flammeovirga kamogawensis]QWG06164.1 YtxH domain-containing protein [Flammeovirga kamogawensis]TRX67995.1 YtxH domain-containing protein [Flammeovirga kamogawensis]